MSDPADNASLIEKLEALEGRATSDFLAGEYRRLPSGDRLPQAPSRRGRVIRSSAKLLVFDMLDADASTGERRLFALVDAVCCLLVHTDRYGGEETARLALEAVVHPTVAAAAVRALTAEA